MTPFYFLKLTVWIIRIFMYLLIIHQITYLPMKREFWADSWQEGGRKTSFHRSDIHPYILRHLPPEQLANKRLLVPLCGKSVDLMYFRTHAAHVVGVEFITEAVEQFFEEQQLAYEKVGNQYRAEKITLINGDFFQVSKQEVGAIDLIYDRACLVALPLPLRQKYIAKIEELLPIGAQQFVNTLEYFPTKAEPPFSVSPEEVQHYYGHSHSIVQVEDQLVPQHGLKRVWNLDYVKEHGFMLTKDKAVAERLNTSQQLDNSVY